MTKNDYIEKITQNLEHLTKDELKDVCILTTAQLGVRSKFAERQQLEHEIENLTSQLQQQALPVVPDYVGNAVMKINLEHLFTGYTNGINEKAKNWLERHKGVKSLGYYVCQLRFQGFTIEKPQLFYLKHIDMSKLDETHDWFILHHGSLGHSPFCKGELPYYCNNAKFTQQEIDSMQTGSYELVPVEDNK